VRYTQPTVLVTSKASEAIRGIEKTMRVQWSTQGKYRPLAKHLQRTKQTSKGY